MRFNPEAVHAPGKELVIPDTLEAMRRKCRQEEVLAYVDSVISTAAVTQPKKNLLKESTSSDRLLQKGTRKGGHQARVAKTHSSRPTGVCCKGITVSGFSLGT